MIIASKSDSSRTPDLMGVKVYVDGANGNA